MPFPIPTKGALDAPSVCLQVNQEWVAFVIGALETLLTRSTYGQDRNGVYMSNPTPVWEGDENAQYAADQEIQKIIAALMTGNCEGETMPTGSIIAFYGSVAPFGWLLCDGATVSSAVYPVLAAVLGVTGDFQLPDLRGRVPVGTGTGFDEYWSEDLTTRTLGEIGGSEKHELATENMATHSHDVQIITPNANGETFGMVKGDDTGTTLVLAFGANYVPVNHMPPYLVVNYIIKV